MTYAAVDRDPLVYERTDLSAAAAQLKREDREAEAAAVADVAADVPVVDVGGRRHDQDSQMDALYDFLTDMMSALNDVMRDLLSMSAIPDLTVLSRIFLAQDRKIYVGTFMVLLSVLYLFVFINNSS